MTAETITEAAAERMETPGTEIDVSVIIPVYNEDAVVGRTLEKLLEEFAAKPEMTFEIIVVDDGSTDSSADSVREFAHPTVRLVSHPYNIGNGAAIKTGIRNARGRYMVMMDADGQHQPSDVFRLLKFAKQYDMVVGARKNRSNMSLHRMVANSIYDMFAGYICGCTIEDLTSGFRLIRTEVASSFVYLLPNTFSYPATLTLAVLRAGYSLKYTPIANQKRVGKSKIRLLTDGVRFLMIILRIGVFFSPLKVFLPLSALLFGSGFVWYLYRHLIVGKGFPPVSSLLMITSVVIFCIGLISEQIAFLRYERK